MQANSRTHQLPVFHSQSKTTADNTTESHKIQLTNVRQSTKLRSKSPTAGNGNRPLTEKFLLIFQRQIFMKYTPEHEDISVVGTKTVLVLCVLQSVQVLITYSNTPDN